MSEQSIFFQNILEFSHTLRRAGLAVSPAQTADLCQVLVRGETNQLAKEMRYLQHRAHRLIWLNPLSGEARYRPLVGGMAAALPYVDDFLPIHNRQSLSALAEHLASLGSSATPKRVVSLRPTART